MNHPKFIDVGFNEKKCLHTRKTPPKKLCQNHYWRYQVKFSLLCHNCRKNAQLDSELREANQKLKMNMMTSIATMEPTESLKQLQEENMLLKQQLSRSMTSLISTGKVNQQTNIRFNEEFIMFRLV